MLAWICSCRSYRNIQLVFFITRGTSANYFFFCYFCSVEITCKVIEFLSFIGWKWRNPYKITHSHHHRSAALLPKLLLCCQSCCFLFSSLSGSVSVLVSVLLVFVLSGVVCSVFFHILSHIRSSVFGQVITTFRYNNRKSKGTRQNLPCFTPQKYTESG